MDLPKTKDGYAQFLKTAFWKDLTARKKKMVGRCEQCGGTGQLESHHIYYPLSWFDTTLEMLQVLCRSCHRGVHGVPVVKKPRQDTPLEFESMHELMAHRSKKLIDRETFRKQKRLLLKRGGWHGMPGSRSAKRKKKRHVSMKNSFAKGLNFTHPKNWVNRGTSSN